MATWAVPYCVARHFYPWSTGEARLFSERPPESHRGGRPPHSETLSTLRGTRSKSTSCSRRAIRPFRLRPNYMVVLSDLLGVIHPQVMCYMC